MFENATQSHILQALLAIAALALIAGVAYVLDASAIGVLLAGAVAWWAAKFLH